MALNSWQDNYEPTDLGRTGRARFRKVGGGCYELTAQSCSAPLTDLGHDCRRHPDMRVSPTSAQPLTPCWQCGSHPVPPLDLNGKR